MSSENITCTLESMNVKLLDLCIINSVNPFINLYTHIFSVHNKYKQLIWWNCLCVFNNLHLLCREIIENYFTELPTPIWPAKYHERIFFIKGGTYLK